jgi:hypothetical protein
MKFFQAFVLCVLTLFVIHFASLTIIDYGYLLAQYISLPSRIGDYFFGALFIYALMITPLFYEPVFLLFVLIGLLISAYVIFAYSKDWSKLGGLLFGALVGIFVLKLVDAFFFLIADTPVTHYSLTYTFTRYIGILPILFMIAGLIWFKHIMKWIHLGGVTLGTTLSFSSACLIRIITEDHWSYFLRANAVETFLLLGAVAIGMVVGNWLGIKYGYKYKDN